jgi:hypothetical protein
LTARDGVSSTSRDFTLTVQNQNDIPEIDTIPTLLMLEDVIDAEVTISGDLISDQDGDDLTYELEYLTGSDYGLLPSWLSFDASSLKISGTADQTEVGSHTLRLTARDGVSSTSRDFTLTVQNQNQKFTFDESSTVVVTDKVEQQIVASSKAVSVSGAAVVIEDLDFNYDNFRAGQLQQQDFLSPSLEIPLTKYFTSLSDVEIGEVGVRVLEIEEPDTQPVNIRDSNEFELKLTFNAKVSPNNGIFEISTYPDARGVDARAWLIQSGGSIANIRRDIQNDTLIYNQESMSLTINFLALIDEFNEASRVPISKQDYYMIIEGLPFSSVSGDDFDTIEALVTLV